AVVGHLAAGGEKWTAGVRMRHGQVLRVLVLLLEGLGTRIFRWEAGRERGEVPHSDWLVPRRFGETAIAVTLCSDRRFGGSTGP
ncbi:MAG: hypothetical protein PVF54_08205, partial [Anaerolineae bacterium]